MDTTPNANGLGGGRRIITILFCDVRGSTAAAGQLDPEEWAEIMNGAFEQIMQPVYRYEGTVVRLLGDAMLAFFGAPIAREDDPQRAVLAGLEIQKAVKAYGDGVQRRWGVNFSVRCGINTGLVVVGAIGSSQHAEYTAMGDAVNLAARMEQTAQPGTVQISEATFRLVAPVFDVEDLGEIEVKGKERPQHAYRVLGQRAEPGPLRGIPGMQTPLVGRAAEFASLVSVGERLQRGTGGIVYIVGEAGLGKSRLLRELRQYIANAYPDTHWYQAGSFSYEKAQPYGQVQRLLRGVFSIARDDAPEVQREKIAHKLGMMTLPDPEQAQQALEVLFGVADGSPSPTRLEGEAFRGSLFAVMIPFWRELSSMHAVVVAFDDAQWMDAASAALLDHVLGSIGGIRTLLLCAMRPSEKSAGWSLMHVAQNQFPGTMSTIWLQPLSPSENEQLISNLLPGDEVPAALRQQILEKAAGNPLFVEEVVRVLKDGSAAGQRPDAISPSGALELNVLQIPENLQTLLIARVDHLEPGTRETLLLASVLGPAFSYRVLKRISDRTDDELTAHLAELQHQGIIRETAATPELRYRFLHVLLQETAYRMILRSERRQHHRLVAEALEELYDGNLDEHAVVLAHHFDKAEELRRAIDYYTVAGDAAFRLYSLPEAVSHFSRALELLRQQGVDELTQQCRKLLACKGRALELNNQFEAALESYDEMQALARQCEDRNLELAAIVARLPLYSVPTRLFNPQLAIEEGRTALNLARELGDRAAEARLLWSLSNAHSLINDLDSATELGEQSLALAEELELRDQMAHSLIGLGVFCYGVGGYFDKAIAALRQAAELCRELGDVPMLTDALASLSMISVFAGAYEQAIAYSEEAREISESIHNLWGQSYSRYKVGTVYWEYGEPDRAIDTIQTGMRLGEQAGFLASQIEPRVDLAAIYGELGDFERALNSLKQALEIPSARHLPDHAFTLATQTRLLLGAGDIAGAEKLLETHKAEYADATWPAFRGRILAAEAEVGLAKGDYQRVADVGRRLLDDLRRNNMRSRIPSALLLQGRAHIGLGDKPAARDCLREAQAEAEELGSRWMLWQILAALAEVEEDAAEAEDLRTQAHDLVKDIARHVSEPALRRCFLQRPDIKALGGDPVA